MCSSGGTGVKNAGQNRDSVRSTIITQQPSIRFYEWVRGKMGGGVDWGGRGISNMDFIRLCTFFFSSFLFE